MKFCIVKSCGNLAVYQLNDFRLCNNHFDQGYEIARVAEFRISKIRIETLKKIRELEPRGILIEPAMMYRRND